MKMNIAVYKLSFFFILGTLVVCRKIEIRCLFLNKLVFFTLLFSSFQDRKLLNALMEVIAQPLNYFKYANVSHTLMPQSLIRLLTSKVRRFFSS